MTPLAGFQQLTRPTRWLHRGVPPSAAQAVAVIFQPAATVVGEKHGGTFEVPLALGYSDTLLLPLFLLILGLSHLLIHLLRTYDNN